MINWYALIENIDINNNVEDLDKIIIQQEDLIRGIEAIRKDPKFLEQLKKIKNEKWHEKVKTSATRMFLGCQNSTSIVFHDSVISNSSILMLGDITKTIIENNLKYDFYKHYHSVKVPHHGTSTHYSKYLPTSENFLISSGEKNGYRKIASNYQKHMPMFARRLCTSGYNHCEIIDNYKICAMSSCSNQIVRLSI